MRVLRGRVVVREDLKADTAHFKSIVVPDVFATDDKDAVARNRTWHIGEVLALGDPALTKKGVEVPHGFAVGDRVVFHFEHHEKAWTVPWIDGAPAVWLPQSAVDAVVE